MADPRASMLAAIRDKGQTPAVEFDHTKAPPSKPAEPKPSPPVSISKSNNDSMPRGPAPAALAMKAALAQMGGNIRANLKNVDTTEKKPIPVPPAKNPVVASIPKKANAAPVRPPPLAFTAADLQAQLKKREEKKQTVESMPPKLNLEDVPPTTETARKSIVSYRQGMLTVIDPPAKNRSQTASNPPASISKLPSLPKTVLPSMVSTPGRSDSGLRKAPPPVKASVPVKIPRSDPPPLSNVVEETNKKTDSPKIPDSPDASTPKNDSSKKADELPKEKRQRSREESAARLERKASRRREREEKPRDRRARDSSHQKSPSESSVLADDVSTPPAVHHFGDAISPPTKKGKPPRQPTYDSSGNYKLLTEPTEIQRAWRKLSCRVLVDGDSRSEVE